MTAEVYTCIYDRGAHAVTISGGHSILTSNGTMYFTDPKYVRDQLNQLYPDRELLCVIPHLIEGK